MCDAFSRNVSFKLIGMSSFSTQTTKTHTHRPTSSCQRWMPLTPQSALQRSHLHRCHLRSLAYLLCKQVHCMRMGPCFFFVWAATKVLPQPINYGVKCEWVVLFSDSLFWHFRIVSFGLRRAMKRKNTESNWLESMLTHTRRRQGKQFRYPCAFNRFLRHQGALKRIFRHQGSPPIASLASIVNQNGLPHAVFLTLMGDKVNRSLFAAVQPHRPPRFVRLDVSNCPLLQILGNDQGVLYTKS